MAVIEKSGMLVNANNEVVGWVLGGDTVDLKDGDTIVSHHKTAEKMGHLEAFKAMKAENAPKKEPKEKVEGEKKERGPRRACPTTGSYIVAKAETLTDGDDCERKEVAKLLASNTSFEEFWKNAPAEFSHVGRNGEAKTFKTTGFVLYAIERGMITVD